MHVEGSVALVTGANRGLGKAYVDALLAAGAKKIYAGTRQPPGAAGSRVIPLKLDVTLSADIEAARQRCGDVNILFNNAGIMLKTTMLSEQSAESMRREMNVNVFGTLAMIQAFAPILAKNGGGAIANLLSVESWFTYPFNATYCASKLVASKVGNRRKSKVFSCFRVPAERSAGSRFKSWAAHDQLSVTLAKGFSSRLFRSVARHRS
jgi:NAD(P)-dependent dehydrogenase (short-subunit alcohol dehydrogenase family)